MDMARKGPRENLSMGQKVTTAVNVLTTYNGQNKLQTIL